MEKQDYKRVFESRSSMFFNCIVGEIFSNIEWEKKGVNISGTNLTNLIFADGVVLFANKI